MAEIVAFWFCAVVFGLWAAASLLILAPPFAQKMRLYDVLVMLPEWKFFAPNPARGDFNLLYRDRLASGETTGFVEIRFLQPRPWWACFWNPQRRGGKALFDSVIELARYNKDLPEGLPASMPYLTLLQHISSLPRLNAATHTQFLVLYSGRMHPGEEPQVVYLSVQHEL